MKEMHCIVHGKVQGVWYRAWAAETAREMGLAGWVRNRTDGCVEITAQGSTVQLEEYRACLYDGPPLARVSDVTTDFTDPDEIFEGFKARY
ncbi:acylphosphatase [uncultured Pseudodesulfovibrio sp.]|uniref:acylphosphatase n=1 Tax=uncultured Pseudodesulfovibrio sp. TaxID=2035858 RepID=UPI0029C7AD71|nr:acylphosphatase [uncultured Pseudodesulfovibrio sp.]